MGLRENLPGQGQTEKKERLKMPGPQLTTADLNSLLIFEKLCDDWVREVHRFTSERKKKKNYVIFRSSENKKLDSLDGLKKELTDNSFLEKAEFKSAFSHDIVSNKVGANKRARKAAKAWMADPTKQVTPVEEKIIAPVETTTLEEDEKPLVIDEVTTPVVEDIIEVIPAAETEKEVEKEITTHVEGQVINVVEEDTAVPVVIDEVITTTAEDIIEVIPAVETEKEVEEEIENHVEELVADVVEDETNAPVVEDEVTTPAVEVIPTVETEKERQHGITLMEYQCKRGGRVVFQDISKPNLMEWGTPLELEKTVNESLLSMHNVADSKNDPHHCDFLEGTFLTEQVDGIKQLGDLITKVKRVGDGLGIHVIDKELQG